MKSAKRPNILIVMTDQQRADAVSLASDGWTPHLAAFAKDAVNFSETYCPSPHCCPSRTTFFTGLYPSRHGVWNNILNGQALTRDPRPGTPMWSTELARMGYDLHYSGKWHVASATTPKDYGWREHFVSAVAGRDHHGPKWEDYKRHAQEGAATGSRVPGVINRPGYPDKPLYATLPVGSKLAHDESALEGALEALDQVRESPDQPWAIYAGFFAPHDPYTISREWLDRVPDEAVTLPTSYSDEMHDKPAIYRRIREQIWGQLSPEEAREARRHYLASCAYNDSQFGRLLERVKAIGAENDTLVIFVSDHGDYAGDHGLFTKGIAAFRGAYHVPAFVRWPGGGIGGGRVCSELVSLADFGPTILDLAGIDFSTTAFSGRSLTPLLRGHAVPGWREFLATQCNGVELGYSQRAIFNKDWKYVFNGFDYDELYELRTDPHELVNLATRAEHRETIRGLCRRLWQMAHAENDTMINDYYTVGLAPFGPAQAFGD